MGAASARDTPGDGSRAVSSTRPHVRPIFGFGPWGWVLLAVLIAFAACLLAGINVRFHIQQAAYEVFGLEVMYNFTIYGIEAQGLAFGQPTLMPLAALPMLLALDLSPGRWRFAPGFVVVLWAVAEPGVWFTLFERTSARPLVLPSWILRDPSIVVALLLDSILLGAVWVVTRDWLVPAASGPTPAGTAPWWSARA